jgi:hypothetical protein
MLLYDLSNCYLEAHHFLKTLFKHPEWVITWIEEAQKKVALVQYGIGGQVVPRGVMCANPFWEMDIQVTYTRGALRLRKPQREKYYRYSFDAEGRLLLVENFCDVDQIEVIVRKGDIFYGLGVPKARLAELSANCISVRGDIMREDRIEAEFYTSQSYLELYERSSIFADRLEPLVEGAVIQYENDMPVRYHRVRTYLEYDDNKNIIGQDHQVRWSYRLYANEKKDIVQVLDVMDEQDDGHTRKIRNLARPVPYKRWHNNHGLLP